MPTQDWASFVFSYFCPFSIVLQARCTLCSPSSWLSPLDSSSCSCKCSLNSMILLGMFLSSMSSTWSISTWSSLCPSSSWSCSPWVLPAAMVVFSTHEIGYPSSHQQGPLQLYCPLWICISPKWFLYAHRPSFCPYSLLPLAFSWRLRLSWQLWPLLLVLPSSPPSMPASQRRISLLGAWCSPALCSPSFSLDCWCSGSTTSFTVFTASWVYLTLLFPDSLGRGLHWLYHLRYSSISLFFVVLFFSSLLEVITNSNTVSMITSLLLWICMQLRSVIIQ